MFKLFYRWTRNRVRYVHSHLRWSEIKDVRVSTFLKEYINDVRLWSFLFRLLIYFLKLFYASVCDTNITERIDSLSFFIVSRFVFRSMILPSCERYGLALFRAKQFEIHRAFIKNNCGLIIILMCHDKQSAKLIGYPITWECCNASTIKAWLFSCLICAE